MENMTVRFLSENYELPINLKQFVSYAREFEEYNNGFVQLTTKCIEETERRANGPMPDVTPFNDRFEFIAKDIITKLSNNGVYDVTIDDLLKNNNGYKHFTGTQIQTLQKLYASLLSTVQTLEQEHQRAYNEAMNQVTGSGISIWTSSIAEAFVFAALESSTVKQQTNAASKQFNEEIKRINAKSTSSQQKTEREIMIGFFYPEILKAFAMFTSEAMDVFLTALERNGKFEYQALKRYNLIRSNDLLKNIDIVSDKKSLLRQAFICCPYNPDIYAKLIDYDFADVESFATARDLLQTDTLCSYIVSKIKSNFKEYERVTLIIKILSVLTNRDEQSLYTSEFGEQVLDITNRYRGLCDIIKSDERAIKWINLHTSSDIEKFLALSRNDCHMLLSNVLNKIASCQLVEHLINAKIIIPNEISAVFSTDSKYEDILNYLYHDIVDALYSAIGKVKIHRATYLEKAQKVKAEYENALEIYNEQISRLQSSIGDLEKQLKGLKLFDFSQKKQLKGQIIGLRQKIAELEKENDLSLQKEQYEQLLAMANQLSV